MTTVTKTLLGWRIDTADASIELNSETAKDFARIVLRLPRIERYGPAPAKP